MASERSAGSPLNDPGTPAIRLSPRQIECLTLISLGKTSGEIAKQLGLSPRTVDHYVAVACAKLGVRTRAQVVARAIGLGLIPNPSVSR